MPSAVDWTEASALTCGLDIGGTLAKAVLFVPDVPSEQDDEQLGVVRGSSLERTERQQLAKKALVAKKMLKNSTWIENELTLKVEGGSLLFLKFLSRESPQASKLIEYLGLIPKGTRIYATGGGAHKFESGIEQIGMKMAKFDEMETLAVGLRLLSGLEGEYFRLRHVHFHGAVGFERNLIHVSPMELSPQEGFLVVNIGSGVSFLHCTQDAYQRVGGSSLGGSTFLGLVALLTGVDQFDKAIDLAAKGDSGAIDMLVRDIYGDSTKELFGLRPTTLASSFGKAIDKKFRKLAKKEDLALATLIMISMNVAALAHLHANLTGAKHIVFTGNFLARSGDAIKRTFVKVGEQTELHIHKRNAMAMRTLAYATKFWSAGQRVAVFVRHEGYLGALGAVSKGLGEIHIPHAIPSQDHMRAKL